MTPPKRKLVSDHVFERIILALNVIRHDNTRPRTKREIERIAGLGHDTVARAFRQDTNEHNTYRITDQFNALTAPLNNKRLSPSQDQQTRDRQTITDLKHQIADLHRQLDTFAMATYAFYLAQQPQTDDADTHTVVPIGRNRKRQR